MILTIVFLLIAVEATAQADQSDVNGRTLFRFDQPDSAQAWQTVNDGVMGGRSVGRFRINEEERLMFFGSLSLENNGGFASVRARGSNLALVQGDTIVARVRGDGRTYNFNLYSQNDRYSYRKSFETVRDKWIIIQLPVSQFVATWRGRRFPNQELSPDQVTGLGFLLSDKQPGTFELEVDWIRVKSLAE